MTKTTVEANAEKQSFPNLYIWKLPLKTGHMNYRKDILIWEQGVFFLNLCFCASADFL